MTSTPPLPFWLDPNHIKFKRLSVKDGLSQSSVTDILQDQQGFMWFGTWDGLNRYDGYTFKVYRHQPENSHSISHNSVFALTETANGILWLGTDGGGLNRFDPKTERFTCYYHDPAHLNSLPHNSIQSICSDREGTLWIGTHHGAAKFTPQNETFTRYTHDPHNRNSLNHNMVYTVYVDSQGYVWFGTHIGLCRLDPRTEQFTTYRISTENDHEQGIHAIYEDRRGQLWVGTPDGINQFDRQQEKFIPFTSLAVLVSYITESSDGYLWLASQTTGLYLLHIASQTVYAYPHGPQDNDSFSVNSAITVCHTKQGIVWIGTVMGGINQLDSKRKPFARDYTRPYQTNTLSNDTITSLYETPQGDLWIATQFGGLNHYDPVTKIYTHYRHDPANPNTLSGDSLFHLYGDKQGLIWLGVFGGGLNCLNPETGQITRYEANPDNPHSLSHDIIWDIYEDLRGQLWVSTLMGLSLFRPATGDFINYRHEAANPHSLSHNHVRDLVADPLEDCLWVATHGGGLNRFDYNTQQFSHYTTHDGLADDSLVSLLLSRDNTLWVGSKQGLSRFDRVTQRFTAYRPSDGLSSGDVNGILEDDAGNLWVSTFNGLTKFNPITKKCVVYDPLDGLPSDFFPLSCFKNQHGQMYFGGNGGFIKFDPRQIKTNPYAPAVHLTELLLFNQTVTVGDNSPLTQTISMLETLHLSAEDYIFSFEFAALDYSLPEKNQYAYQMEGFDKNWNYTTARRRFATYTNLPSGTYTFRVKAANHDGVWNEQGTTLTITVAQSHWEKLQAEKKAAEAANQAKSAFLANMSHELRTPLNGILGYAQLIQMDSDLSAPHRHYVGIIEKSGHHLLTLINEILDLARIESGRLELNIVNFNLAAVLQTVQQMIAIRAEAKGLYFQIEQLDLPLMVETDQQQLQQVLLNLLGNAIKFTPSGGSVTLRVSEIARWQEDEWANNDLETISPPRPLAYSLIRFEVIDTGIGIAEADQPKVFQPFQQVGEASYKAQGTGLGLAISQNMVALLGGELQLKSVFGQGSTFWFELKLPVVAPSTVTQIDSRGIIRGLADGPNTILVVDDMAENRQLLLDFLTPLGFKVEEAASGDEVLFKLQTFPAAAIITDLMMPGMDGFELVQFLRQVDFGYRLVIIAASASVFAEDAQRSLDLGCDAFLPKPIVFTELLATLEKQLNLTWDYREATAAEAPKMKAPSLAELSLLYDLIVAQNSEAIQTRLHSLKTTQLYPQFVETLSNYLSAEEFEAMLAFVETVMV